MNPLLSFLERVQLLNHLKILMMNLFNFKSESLLFKYLFQLLFTYANSKLVSFFLVFPITLAIHKMIN